MTVAQIRDGIKIQPDCVYVIPPKKHLSLYNGTLQLMDPTGPRSANMPIDTFFRSLAQDQGHNAICIVLSGTGSDGTLGLKAVKETGGMVMVQDEASAKYDGMPRSAINTGLADYVVAPEKMPDKLIGYVSHAIRKTDRKIPIVEGKMPDALAKVFLLLRTHTGHDFSLYKKNTICRRIERRMHVHQIDGIATYVRYLQESERELDVLFKELLIGVTNFFRDPEAYEALKNEALMKILQARPDDYTVRVWAPGCSSGEEAYSLAIILHECMEEIGRHFNVQIFGTDIDSAAVETARIGFYPESVSADVAPDRLKRYFTKEDAGYRIRKSIREMLVFAPQDLIKDPPPSQNSTFFAAGIC
jgi:two-component system CheB/CheR fusion protein